MFLWIMWLRELVIIQANNHIVWVTLMNNKNVWQSLTSKLFDTWLPKTLYYIFLESF